MLKWRVTKCGTCRGYGVVSRYVGGDFDGPGECPECEGGGTIYLRPTGHAFLYPGGPARGIYSPAEYDAAVPFEHLYQKRGRGLRTKDTVAKRSGELPTST